MSFDKLLDEACKLAHLPDMARIHLPDALSDKTIKMVSMLTPDELGEVLATAIDTVNRGSVESIDT